MKEFLQANGISILVILHVLFIGMAMIRFYEKKEKRKSKIVQIDLDEHERMISKN